MDADAREEIEALAEQVQPPCAFVLNGYGEPRPCRLERHEATSVHDCGPFLVVAS